MFDEAREVARQASTRNDELSLIGGQRVVRQQSSRLSRLSRIFGSSRSLRTPRGLAVLGVAAGLLAIIAIVIW